MTSIILFLFNINKMQLIIFNIIDHMTYKKPIHNIILIHYNIIQPIKYP